MSDNKRYFLFDSQQYLYCVPRNDVVSTDPASLNVTDSAKFRYGNLNLSGTVTFFSSKESDVLAEIKRMKKAKRRPKDGSFHEDRPRKAVLKTQAQKSANCESSGKRSKNSDKAQAKRRKKEIRKTHRENAEIKTELLMEMVNNEHDISDGSAATNSVSDASSIAPSSKIVTSNNEEAKLRALSRGTSDSLEQTVSTPVLPIVNEKDNPDKPTAPEPKTTSVTSCNEDTKLREVNSSICHTTDQAMVIQNFSRETQIEKDQSAECKRSSSVETLPAGSTSEENFYRSKSKKKHRSRSKRRGSSRKRKSKSRKRRRRYSSTSSSTSSSSSESSSSSTSTSSSSTSSSSTSSSSETSSSYEKKKRRKKRSKHSRRKYKTVKRNMEIYSGVNYLYNESSVGVTKLWDEYDVYVLTEDLEKTTASAKSVTQFIRNMVDKVYTIEALLNATPQGFPARSRGKKKLRKDNVLPRLHPDGRLAIIAKAKLLELQRKDWRPKQGELKMNQSFTGRCSEIRNEV